MAQESTAPESDTEDDSLMTDNTETRVKYLASVTAFIIQVWWMGIVYLVITSSATVASLTGWPVWVTVMMVLSAAGWTFGLDLVGKYLNKK